MNTAIKSLAALALAMLLAGCASMRGLAPSANIADANTLRAEKSLVGTHLTPAAWPQSDWWKTLNDPQLNALMEEALAGSPTLRIAEARVKSALGFAQSTNAAQFPQINGDAAVTRERFPERGLVPPPFAGAWATQAQLQATLGYEADLWGRNRAAYLGAIGEARAAEIDAFAARLALSVNVVQAYVQFHRAFLQLDVAQKNLREREQLFDLTRQRFEGGLDTRLAVKQAESAVPGAREQIAQLDEAIDLARHQLAALAGQGPDRGLALQRPTVNAAMQAELPAAVPAELIGRRPDLVAQRWRVEAAAKNIDVAKADFYPNVNLSAFIGLQTIGLSGFFQAGNATYGLGPAVTLPIFDAGRLRGNLAQRNAGYDVAVEQYNQTLVDAMRDVVDQLTSMKSVETQRKDQALSEAAAQEAYDLAMQRYREGIGNYLEVLTAENQLLTQQSIGVDLRARELSLSVNLTRALGGGFEPVRMPTSQVHDEQVPAKKSSWLARLFGG
ncbi:MAG: transporter [Betaproteobacteria bacterium]|nr:transporter [Betaproteobacteria bacterium]